MYNLALEKVADALGMDPLEFRLKNLVTQDEVAIDSGMPFSSLGIRQCFEQAAEAIGYSQKKHAPGARTLPDGRLHGIGISGHVDSHGQMSRGCGAILNLTADGKCLIAPGQSHNAGSIIAHCHHVAEVLGMNYEDVNVAEWGNTDVTSEGGSEGGSTRCITLGSAYYEAAMDARNQAFEVAAEAMDTTPDKLSARGGEIFETDNPGNSMTWAAVADRFSHPIVGRGYSWSKTLRRPVLGWDAGEPCEVRGQLASATEIAVDPETGHIEVLAKSNAIDCGKAIYLSGFNKGTYGGCDIQHGETLLYEQVLDASNGATLNANMWQNGHPTAMDINPEGYTAIAVETDDACGPHGCKGVGEPQVSAIASYANAFYNATGKWIDSLPLTPDKVLKALGKA
jgi:CO/xanthine dehydrogenase Mo-binding subunit